MQMFDFDLLTCACCHPFPGPGKRCCWQHPFENLTHRILSHEVRIGSDKVAVCNSRLPALPQVRPPDAFAQFRRGCAERYGCALIRAHHGIAMRITFTLRWDRSTRIATAHSCRAYSDVPVCT